MAAILKICSLLLTVFVVCSLAGYHGGFRGIRRHGFRSNVYGHHSHFRKINRLHHFKQLRKYLKKRITTEAPVASLDFETAFCKSGAEPGIGKKDGKYAHPKHCEKYIVCHGFDRPHEYHHPKVHVEKCEHGFFFNGKSGFCDWPSNVDCFLYQGRTCFGAKDDRYGIVKATQTGYIKGMKVFHVDGYVTCKYYKPTYKSFWGCNTKVQEFKYLINTWITTEADRDGVIFPNYHKKDIVDPYGNYKLEGYHQSSPYLMWLQGPKKPSKVHRGDELRIWYGEDLLDKHQYDNDGKHCVDVYALFSYYRPFYYFETHEHD